MLIKYAEIKHCNFHDNGRLSNGIGLVVDLGEPELIGKRYDGATPYCLVSSLGTIQEIKVRRLPENIFEDGSNMAAVEARCPHTACIHHTNH